MAPKWSRRKTLHLSSTAVLTGLAGCSAAGFDARPQVDTSLGTTAYAAVIDEQPTPEKGVPAVWGILLAHPDAARKLIDWGALTPAEGDSGPGTEFRTFDPDRQFVSVVVGVLPTGDALMDYNEENENIVEDVADEFTDDSVYRNGQLRYDVTSYQAFPPDPDTPEYHYDYSFTLWRLNGVDRPTEITVEYHDP
ncbi:hypothetical protein [Halorubrum sp. N11]|uniref:hypothetical protein n=1 Tax=Halorubrum sp. N11 TaxID=3402276 RepID=UPI003EBBBA90